MASNQVTAANAAAALFVAKMHAAKGETVKCTGSLCYATGPNCFACPATVKADGEPFDKALYGVKVSWGNDRPPSPFTLSAGWPVHTGDAEAKKAIAKEQAAAKNSAVAAALKLDATLDLRRACADFYLLIEASIDGGKAKEMLDAHAAYLARQLGRYCELAALGEARYARGKRTKLCQGRGARFKAFLIRLESAHTGSRRRVWAAWDPIYREFGRQTHVMISQVFRAKIWGSAYGGPKWASIIEAVLAYRRGRLSAIMFVDTAWGLEHNGNIAFSKQWSVAGLRAVMDANLAGETERLAPIASPNVRRVWEQATKGGTE